MIIRDNHRSKGRASVEVQDFFSGPPLTSATSCPHLEKHNKIPNTLFCTIKPVVLGLQNILSCMQNYRIHSSELLCTLTKNAKWFISVKLERGNLPECVEATKITYVASDRSTSILEEACKKINCSNNKQTIQ